MNLNDLFHKKGIDPREVAVLRHRPHEPDLRKVLPLLAADSPDLFNAYQAHPGKTAERTVVEAKFVASFIGLEPGKAVFVGLYRVQGSKSVTHAQYWRIPANLALIKLGMRGFTGKERPSCLWFDLRLEEDFYRSWKGKLVVIWPPPERSWCRRAHRNDMAIHAILEESAFDATVKNWNEIDFTWSELSVLPRQLQARLAEWRGIYLIYDVSDGKGYVGSAYGSDNIFGRWRNYAASGHGGNRLLRQRDPQNFRFTILERVSPDMKADDVIRIESSWKDRLHTRQPHGLNDN